MLVGGDADAEVDVWRLGDAVAALPHLPDRLALTDARTLLERHLLELEQGHGVAVRGADREGATAVRNAPDERHRPGGRRANVAADVGGDVDAAVLTACIGVVAERERAQDCTVDGPAPRERSGSEHEREQGQRRDQSSHCHLRSLRCDPADHRRGGGSPTQCALRSCHGVVTEMTRRGGCGARRSAARRAPPPADAAHRPRPARRRRQPAPSRPPPRRPRWRARSRA